MTFSRWTLVLALSVPWVAVGAVGLHARLSEPDFAHPEYGPSRSGEIEAYIPLIKKTRSILTTNSPMESLDPVRDLARDWVRAYRTGEVKTIHRAHAVDTVRGGARRQILDAMSLVSFHLHFAMRESGMKRDLKAVGEDGMLSLEMSQLLKTEDMASYGVALNNENIVLRTWSSYGVVLSPEQYARAMRWVGNDSARDQYARVLRTELDFVPIRRRAGNKVEDAFTTLVASTKSMDQRVPAIPFKDLPGDAVIAIQLARNARAVLQQRQAYLEHLDPQPALVAHADMR